MTTQPLSAGSGMAEQTDLLDMGRINSLPQPLRLRLCGCKIEWPVESIDVETGLLRFDVCGKLQVGHIGDVAELIDADHARHEVDRFYSDCAEDGAALAHHKRERE